MLPGDNQVLRGLNVLGALGKLTAVQYSVTASVVPLKYDIIIR